MTAKSYMDVIALDQLRDSYVTLFQVAGRAVIVARMGDTVCAFDGTCTHADFQFATSRLVHGREIECPMHGACFDAATGAVTEGPAERALQPLTLTVEEGIVRLYADWADAGERSDA